MNAQMAPVKVPQSQGCEVGGCGCRAQKSSRAGREIHLHDSFQAMASLFPASYSPLVGLQVEEGKLAAELSSRAWVQQTSSGNEVAEVLKSKVEEGSIIEEDDEGWN